MSSRILIKLQLPYRILRLCGKDLSFTSALTYDFEVYSAAQERWLEVSSVSNFETFPVEQDENHDTGMINKKNLLGAYIEWKCTGNAQNNGLVF
jgi:seryl-tRNA synthetase